MQRNRRVTAEMPEEVRDVEPLAGTGFEGEESEAEFESASTETLAHEPEEAA